MAAGIIIAVLLAAALIISGAWMLSRRLAWSDERPPMGDWPAIHPELMGTVTDRGTRGGDGEMAAGHLPEHEIAPHGEGL